MAERMRCRRPRRRSWRASAAWRRGARQYASELLHSRFIAGSTLRAYGRDLLELAAWATARGREPGELAYRDLRAYAAVALRAPAGEGERRPQARLVRGLHAHFVATGAAADSPADLSRHRSAARACHGCSPATRSRSLLERIPARTPLEVRDRALFELVYSCGLRAEEVVGLDLGDVEFESETVRATGKGSKTRVVPIGEPAQRAVRRYLESSRRALGPNADEQALFVSRRGRRLSPSDVRRRLEKSVPRLPWPAGSRRTPCATRSPPTCSRAGRTCARFRSCSGTRASPRPRSTPASNRRGCVRSTQSLIHALEGYRGSLRPVAGAGPATSTSTVLLVPVGKESGAHINPVVTLAFWLMGKIDLRLALGYVFAQLAGAIVGSLPLRGWGSMGESVAFGATLPGLRLRDSYRLDGRSDLRRSP